jgi:hypothetical protein
MNLEEIIKKLTQIEEHAALTLSEYPQRLTVERLRFILSLACQLRAHAQDELRDAARGANEQTESLGGE